MWQVTSSGEKRNTYKILGELYAGMRPLGGVGPKVENNIEMNFLLY
jgi:hypothetical protein